MRQLFFIIACFVVMIGAASDLYTTAAIFAEPINHVYALDTADWISRVVLCCAWTCIPVGLILIFIRKFSVVGLALSTVGFLLAIALLEFDLRFPHRIAWDVVNSRDFEVSYVLLFLAGIRCSYLIFRRMRYQQYL